MLQRTSVTAITPRPRPVSLAASLPIQCHAGEAWRERTMKRREFIGVSASSAVTLSLAARALGGEKATANRTAGPQAVKVSEGVATRTEVSGTRGIVTGGHETEAAAGIAMIQSGGNAIDALVAAAFAGFVVEPASCGLGGYGRLAVWLGRDKRFVTFDHYVRAPGAARPDMFEIDRSKPMKYYGFPYTVGMRAEEGPLAPAVPGAVAGLCDAHAMFGRLKLAQVLEPAIAAAEAGVPVTWSLQLAIIDRLAKIRTLPEIAGWLLRDGLPPDTDDRLDGVDLARTLRRIAAEGKRGFYEGPVRRRSSAPALER